jgi:uncharacterized protein (DUF1800 family)
MQNATPTVPPAATGSPAPPTPAAAPAVSGSMRPIKPEAFGFDQARHLLWRAGFGGTPRQIQTLAEMGPEQAVETLVEYEEIPADPVLADAFRADIMRPPTADERLANARARRTNDEETIAQFRADRQEAQRLDRQQMVAIQEWWLKRMIESPRPLEEKMTLFWHGHFATSYRTIEDSYHMYRQNQFFRKNATGNFADLLYGIIRDPAMLAYLDNNDSRRGQPNENLARELMELFSLGEGNYTEQDIKEGARALTGYTFDDDEFVFNERNHDPNPKRILGKGGSLDGDGFVTAILERRDCSRFLARKLYRAFVIAPTGRDEIDHPAEKAQRDLAATLLRHRYSLKPVLKRLFLSEHFYSPALMGEHIKSPAELVVGAVRSLNTPVRSLTVLNDALNLMGQAIFFPPSVAGWEGGRSWINTATLFIRQNALVFLLTGKLPRGREAVNDEPYDPSFLLGELAQVHPGADRDADTAVEALLRLALGSRASGNNISLRAFVDDRGGRITPEVMTGLLLLITAMPEYQLC